MNNIPQKYNNEETPAYTLLQRIKAGSVDARELDKEQRQACVEVLALEGYKVSEIAQMLTRNEKTIKRDLKSIWQKNASMPTPDFIVREITEMMQKAKANQAHLMHIARSNTASYKEKIEAEKQAWQVAKELSERLQSLGFLPCQPQRVVGELFHHNADKEMSADDFKKQVVDITNIAKDCNIEDEVINQKVNKIKEKIEKLDIKQDVDTLAKDIENAQIKQEEQNE